MIQPATNNNEMHNQTGILPEELLIIVILINLLELYNGLISFYVEKCSGVALKIELELMWERLACWKLYSVISFQMFA